MQTSLLRNRQCATEVLLDYGLNCLGERSHRWIEAGVYAFGESNGFDRTNFDLVAWDTCHLMRHIHQPRDCLPNLAEDGVLRRVAFPCLGW